MPRCGSHAATLVLSLLAPGAMAAIGCGNGALPNAITSPDPVAPPCAGSVGSNGACDGAPDAGRASPEAGSVVDAGSDPDSGGDAGPVTPPPTGGNDHRFGSHSFPYAAGTLKPTGAQSALDATAAGFYDKWKAAYVKPGCGGYYVFTNGGTGSDVGDTVSEGHGYGMVVTALMAGHDPDAQKIFDGMYAFFRKFPSVNENYLMGWTVDVAGGCKFTSGGNDSATDGDLDVAFGLLLADKQWGSAGPIDYLAEAKKVIAAIKKGDMNPTTKLPKLGDWAAATDYSTRPSDFMQDHFRAFQRATGDAFWGATVDGIYGVTQSITTGYSPSTGLMPDFVINANTAAKPAAANFLESPHDGEYDYNSCRNPWRIGTDFVVTGDSRARAAAQKVTSFIKTKAQGNPSKIVDGYKLNGTSYGSYASFAFVAPLGVAAMADPSSQAWLDAIWQSLAAGALQGYYEDSIKLQSMLVMAGDWWAP